jgi:hypothetical protein
MLNFLLRLLGFGKSESYSEYLDRVAQEIEMRETVDYQTLKAERNQKF